MFEVRPTSRGQWIVVKGNWFKAIFKEENEAYRFISKLQEVVR